MYRVTVSPIDSKSSEASDRIHAVQVAAYSQEALLLGVNSLPATERSSADIHLLAEFFIGAFSNGQLVGVISHKETPSAEIEICSLAVLPTFQRRGVARLLLRRVVSTSVDKSIVVSTASANVPALTLYHQEGFSIFRRSTAATLPLEMVHLRRDRSNHSLQPAAFGRG